MSHFDSNHTQPIASLNRLGSSQLPKTTYISLTGEYSGTSSLSSATGKPDPRHIFNWIHVTTGAFEGEYESAIDVYSDRADGTAPDPKEVKFYLMDEKVPESEWPPLGVNKNAALSYAGLGLHEADFSLAEAGSLHSIVTGYAAKCDRMTVFGMTYSDGTGIHDVHLNTGQNRDGAAVFYFGDANDGPVARWVFFKFQTPTLL